MVTWIIEDNLSDARKCTDVVTTQSATQIRVFQQVPFALHELERVVSGEVTAPDVIIVDLNFNSESGFEILRYWRSNSKLKDIRVIVWTAMGETEQEISKLFGVSAVVPKWMGTDALAAAVNNDPKQQAASH